MEDLFDILIPAVIMAVYFFGNLLSKKSDDASGSDDRTQDNGTPELDSEERARRVAETIRKKVESRRNKTAEESSRRPQTSVPEVASMEEKHQSRTFEVPVPEVVSWNEPTEDYGAAMEAQLAKIEATRKQAERLKKKASRVEAEVSKVARRNPKSGSMSRFGRGSVRTQLKDPSAARAAFIYGEVLGSPAGLRKRGESSIPGLKQ